MKKQREVFDVFHKPPKVYEKFDKESKTVTIGYVPLKEKIKRLGRVSLTGNVSVSGETDPEKIIDSMSVTDKRNFDLSDMDEPMARVKDKVQRAEKLRKDKELKEKKEFEDYKSEKASREKKAKEKAESEKDSD